MGEAKEVERGSIRLRMAGCICPPRAEVDEACLVGMKRKPKPGKTLAQHGPDTLGVSKIAERQQRIVGVADKGAIPARRGLTSFSNHSSST
jgi:hypothetical protein